MKPRHFSSSPFIALGMALSLAVCSRAESLEEQNWPQWRGAHQDGVAVSATPPTTWSETNNIKWKIKLPGEGSATPLIWQDRIFVQTALPTGKKFTSAPGTGEGGATAPARGEGVQKSETLSATGRDGSNSTGAFSGGGGGGPRRGRGGRGGGEEKPSEITQFALICLDRGTGKILWQQTAREEVPHEGFRTGDGTFASTSGLTDGSQVYAYFGSHGLFCYDLEGKLKWSKDLGKMRISNGFGEGNSPTVYKDTLIVNWDNEDGSYIVALDKNTGKEIWKNTREERTSWATPLIVVHGGKAQAVTDATKKIRSYDVATGKLLWECEGLTRNVIPSPVADNELIYCMSGFQGNALLAIKIGASGDVTGKDEIAWSYKKSTPYVPSPLLYRGRLYFLASNNGRLSCLEAKTGRLLIDAESIEEIPNVYAAPLGADGKIYIVGRNGTTVVLKEADTVQKLSVNRLDEKIDASPIAAGKDLILRGRQHLYCISEK